MPYFISTLDTIAWRFGIPESVFPQALVPGVREISGALGPLGTWGSLFPRSGFLSSGERLQSRRGDGAARGQCDHAAGSAACVSAARRRLAMATGHPGRPSKTMPTPPCGRRSFPTRRHCHVFAEIDDRGAALSDPYAERLSEHGDYVLNLWRPYACCERAGQVLLFSIDF